MFSIQHYVIKPVRDFLQVGGFLWVLVVPPLYGPCNQCLSPLKSSSNPTHDEVFSIQHYVIKPVRDFLQVGGFLWVLVVPPLYGPCNQCLSPLKSSSNPTHDEVFSIQHYVIKPVRDFLQVGGFLWVLVVPPLYGPCNQCLSPLKSSSNPTHDEVFSIQHYVIKPVRDFLQVGGFLWVLVVPPLYGPCNQCLSPLKSSSNPTHDEVFSIQHYVIKPVRDFLQVGSFLWVLRFCPTIKLTTTV